jgi:leucyl/phenylalanyl-tRNA---protein transferase
LQQPAKTVKMSSSITPQILLKAYAAGIFPMAESADDSALYWIEPELRGVIPLDGFHVPRSLAKRVRRRPFEIRIDRRLCRRDRRLRRAHRRAPLDLDQRAHPRSLLSASQDGILPLGRVLARGPPDGWALRGEDRRGVLRRKHVQPGRDASKVALVHLVARLNAGGFRLLDAQFLTDHLRRFGAEEVARDAYHLLLEPALGAEADFFAFAGDDDPDEVLRLAARHNA